MAIPSRVLNIDYGYLDEYYRHFRLFHSNLCRFTSWSSHQFGFNKNFPNCCTGQSMRRNPKNTSQTSVLCGICVDSFRHQLNYLTKSGYFSLWDAVIHLDTRYHLATSRDQFFFASRPCVWCKRICRLWIWCPCCLPCVLSLTCHYCIDSSCWLEIFLWFIQLSSQYSGRIRYCCNALNMILRVAKK